MYTIFVQTKPQTMITSVKKTRTGYKLIIAAVTDQNEICHLTILCSHIKSEQEAKERALQHVKTHLINFDRYPNEQEYKDLRVIV